MKRLAVMMLVLAFLAAAGRAQAADKADPTGTWKWPVTSGDQTVTVYETLKLKLEGQKLTGALVRGEREYPFQDGEFKDGKVSFKFVRELRGSKITTKYTGQVEGDTIKGKCVLDSGRGGEPQTREWEAKRAKD